jgi:AraC-like DNA-binding protein
MFVPPDQMRAVAREAGIEGDLDVKVRQNSDRALFAAHDRFYRSIEGHATRLERQTLFLAALKKLLTSSFGARPARSAAAAGKSARAKAHMDANFERPIDLAELAEVSGLGRFQLIRAFKADYGCAPHAYQIDRRLARARKLLARGAAPAQVALEVGFADQSHLTRHFKRIFGATPGSWAGRA